MDSHGVDKPKVGSFRGRIWKFAWANKVILVWSAVLLGLLGYLGWAYYYGDQDRLLSAIIWLGYFACAAFVYSLFLLGLFRSKDTPTNSLPLVDVQPPMSKKDEWDWWGQTIYPLGGMITGFVVFVASWIYCIATYGYLLGVGLGWLPSIIVAYIAGLLWPLLFIAIVILGLLIFK